RGVAGAYDRALKGIEACKKAGLEFQINTTITKRNLEDIDKIFDLVIELGAVAHHIFLLVPTGRGKAIEDEEIPPEEYERVLNWMYDKQHKMDTMIGEGHIVGHGSKMFMKATCAPHFFRVMHQRSKENGSNIAVGRAGLDSMTKGCLGGTGFAFISRTGDVFPCGYLPVSAGNVREKSFKTIWEDARLFNDLRDPKKLKGKCGACEYKIMCGGCRARAYARTGDYLAEEPYCIYKPKAWKAGA
ncbi:MAG: SPASM domain-containing protein, partial [Candidatus Hydrothermarchaeales archaeon]